jgi:hypothetical protein
MNEELCLLKKRIREMPENETWEELPFGVGSHHAYFAGALSNGSAVVVIPHVTMKEAIMGTSSYEFAAKLPEWVEQVGLSPAEGIRVGYFGDIEQIVAIIPLRPSTATPELQPAG